MTREELYELKHKRAQLVEEGKGLLAKKDLEGHGAKMAEIDQLNGEINAAEKQLAEEGRFEDGEGGLKALAAAQARQKDETRKTAAVDELRASGEYARAFAKAMRRGAQVKKCAGVEDLAPLYKALTESGGTPAGADGGFLAPIDFDHQIHRLEKDYLDLSALFTVETVTTLSGWRVVEDGLPKKLPKVAEMGTIGREDQPKFRRVDYAVEKYAERLPISNELLEDNAAGLLAYAAAWFAPKYILTKNSLLLAFLKGLASTALTAGQEDKLLRKALIAKLNTAHSRRAVLLTNQSGYAEMDGWEDKNGRPLLVPNPADPQVLRYRGRQVVYGDDTELPGGEGSIPLYVGNFKALGTLFVRKGIELATTDVGGDAWATDSMELRAICRLDAVEMDPAAGFQAALAAGG
jgi:HK97 family phage major capsid protein